MSGPSTKDVLDSVISTGQAVRDRLDPAVIASFIAAQPGITGPVEITSVAGDSKVGASSGIVMFTAAFDDGSGRREHSLVLRYAPGNAERLWVAYDMAHQARVQHVLQRTALPVPKPLFVDGDGHALGLPGYIMTTVSGEAPSPSAFVQGPLAEASPQERATMLGDVMDALVRMHELPLSAEELRSLQMDAPGNSAMERCINWYWATWEWIDQPGGERLVPVRNYLLANAPVGGEVLTHGDSTLHNYLFSKGRLTGVLDFEMACIGRPETDLALQCVGNAIFAAPPESGALQPPNEAEWLELYRAAGGRKLESLAYYRRLAGYMIVIAIIALQRNMPADLRASQKDFVEILWREAEGR